ncbi:MAG: Rossmann-like and DUF2520 domain-containing protein [Bacteroidota bacterium]
MNKKHKIVLIGSGNVAEHLLRAFAKSNSSEIVQLYSRNKETGSKLAETFGIDFCNDISKLFEADLYLISVSDSAISELSSSLPFSNRLVAHTSGATNINTIDSKNSQAVFYPLQTFTKNKKIDFSKIPICLETTNLNDCKLLTEIAGSISKTVQTVTSEQRQYLHVSAVFVNNFTNHLFHIGKEIADHHNVDFDLLKPLIAETVEKLNYKTPKDAQTGPALRGDKNTMEKHLKIIPNKKHREIYRLITESIFETYNKKW